MCGGRPANGAICCSRCPPLPGVDKSLAAVLGRALTCHDTLPSLASGHCTAPAPAATCHMLHPSVSICNTLHRSKPRCDTLTFSALKSLETITKSFFVQIIKKKKKYSLVSEEERLNKHPRKLHWHLLLHKINIATIATSLKDACHEPLIKNRINTNVIPTVIFGSVRSSRCHFVRSAQTCQEQ